MEEAVVVVVGSGGREHALCLALAQSARVTSIHCVPGNAGTAQLATNHQLDDTSNSGLTEFCQSVDAHLVVVGPEAPLCAGLADACNEVGIPCFGPVAALAHLEGSKLHAKETMTAAGVPTADYQRLDSNSDIDAALDTFASDPWVVKRDVLAGGKGVIVTRNRQEAYEFIQKSIKTDGFVLLEAFLSGEEASMLVVMDGTGFCALPASQDHKRAYDGDEGPNTGGMGAYCPAPVIDGDVRERVMKRIVEPMHAYLSSQPIPYRGVLFVGLMIDEKKDPYVVEFNVRFGDPECQVTLPLVTSDLFSMLYAAATDGMSEHNATFSDQSAVTVVLASEGYPRSPLKGRTIGGLDEVGESTSYRKAWINFAGVSGSQSTGFIASGGRVLSCTAMGDNLADTQKEAYKLIQQLSLQGGHFRRDIAHRALRR